MKKNILCLILLYVFTFSLVGCGTDTKSDSDNLINDNSSEGSNSDESWMGIAKTGELTLVYAEQFKVEYFGEYTLISVTDGRKYLLVPEGASCPDGIEDTVILNTPLDNTYLSASSVMDYLINIDVLSSVKFSSIKEDGWHLPEAVDKMKSGEIVYAGKYSAPDYELLIENDCNFALQSTMIYHNPEIIEQLESVNIPVFVDRSSYEASPLGRMEWIRLYGVLFGKEKEATEIFEKKLAELPYFNGTGKEGPVTAFFYVTQNKAVNVRKSNDYISKMIRDCGGQIVSFDSAEEENALSTLTVQMEAFYAGAKDADILIYNSTIYGEIESTKELIAMSSLFSDFKAVKEGKVYCVTCDFFQKPTAISDFMIDLKNLYDGNIDSLTYLRKLD